MLFRPGRHLLALLWLLPLLAQAACMTPSARRGTTLDIVARSVRIQPDQAIGSRLGTWTSTSVANGWQRSIGYGLLDCRDGGGSIGWMGDTPVGADGVYPTGKAGIGIRFRLSGALVDQTRGTLLGVVLESGGPRLALAEGKYLANTLPWVLTYSLVKTGPIELDDKLLRASFHLSSAALAGVWVGGDGDVSAGTVAPRTVAFNLASNARWHLSPATCSVTTPDLSVQMNTALLRYFLNNETNIGLTPFTVGLTCPGGGGSLKRVSVVLSDNVRLGNSSDVLGLTPYSTASGVGIQVLYAGVPVRLQADSTDTRGVTPATALAVGTVNGKQFNIPFSARYVATHGNQNVEVGTVNARMSLTVYYD